MTTSSAVLVPVPEVLPLRERYRSEMNCQIVHDSIHRRPGWTQAYLLRRDGVVAGYGLMAVAGPWVGKPTVFEFYVLPEHRLGMFDLFGALLGASGARHIETQTSNVALAVMLHAWSPDAVSEKIVFRDWATTEHPANGAVVRQVTEEGKIRRAIAERQGGGEWVVELAGQEVGKGGVLFHYNPPYGDLYMEVAEPFRRRGLGSYLLQELKRETYARGQVPCARCHPANTGSRQTLQRAGFAPCGHMLTGSIRA